MLITMNDCSEIKFYSTLPHPCSYIDDMPAVTIFMDPEEKINRAQTTILSELGFRRSGTHIYRPSCPTCQACIPVRLPVHKFKAKKSARRTLKRNSDVSTEWIESIDNDECFELYQRYINERHSDGDMFPATRDQYQKFLVNGLEVTKYVAFRVDGKLIAIAVMDQLDDGYSAVYTFFSPNLSERSLGRYAILWQIEMCTKAKLPYLYLGYWIRDCDKMSYKTQYRPVEMYTNNRWIHVE